jgi:hypothetical protein
VITRLRFCLDISTPEFLWERSLTLKQQTVAAFLVSVFLIGDCEADSLCKAIALKDVATALNGSAHTVRKGSYFENITAYKIDKKNETKLLCSHSLCYSTYAYEKAKKVEVLRLVNCKIGDVRSDDPDQTEYALEVTRSETSTTDLRRTDLINRFLDIGLCNACADNVAAFYLKKPTSRCAQLARNALEGDPSAIKKLTSYTEYPSYCQWSY